MFAVAGKHTTEPTGALERQTRLRLCKQQTYTCTSKTSKQINIPCWIAACDTDGELEDEKSFDIWTS